MVIATYTTRVVFFHCKPCKISCLSISVSYMPYGNDLDGSIQVLPEAQAEQEPQATPEAQVGA